jgi:hypothetical protein
MMVVVEDAGRQHSLHRFPPGTRKGGRALLCQQSLDREEVCAWPLHLARPPATGVQFTTRAALPGRSTPISRTNQVPVCPGRDLYPEMAPFNRQALCRPS